MFDLANDRHGYSGMLKPDPEYTLDFAVGTTYSLDLEALLGIPVTLGLQEDIEEENLRNPLYVLEAIRKCSDRLAILCNAGGIKLPEKIQSVFSLLENSVFEVNLPGGGNFHPKVWVLRYSREGALPRIRFVVMSRNLTFDRSIDVCASMDGVLDGKQNPRHRPLADMLRFLAEYAGKKKQQVLALAEDVLRVSAFEVMHPFREDYDFYPMGIPGYPGKDIPLLRQKYDLFAVSPFLSDGVVHDLTRFSGQKCLVTRKSSVTKTVMEAFDGQVYVTKDVLNDNEFRVRQDIHAKLYYVTTREGNYLYLGSANASRNAFARNVEFMLRLAYMPNLGGFKRVRDDFIPKEAEKSPFELLNGLPAASEEEGPDPAVEEALREAISAIRGAVITPDARGYTVQIHTAPLHTKKRVWISPLQQIKRQRKELTGTVVFSGLLLRELSEFYILEVEKQRVVVKISTRGMPANRDQEIYRFIIDSPEKFLRYLSFMLSGDLGEAAGEASGESDEQTPDSPAADRRTRARRYSAIYEQMLRVFHQNPAQIREVADMVRRLDPSVIGEDFSRMFRQFESAVKKVIK